MLDSIDHIAIQVSNVSETVAWYRERFGCQIVYQDETWAMVEFANVKLAFVVAGQHPPHLGLVHEDATKFGALTTHRDGTRSCYIADPAGNAIEVLDAGSMPA